MPKSGPESSPSSTALPSLREVQTLVADDLAALDRCILSSLSSEVALVDQVARHIVGSGGKRLRPLLVLLAARACGYQGADHITASAIVEFIHTATLLHDDVVDGSKLRRGKDTANSVFGNEASVLVGDFLYSRAFQMMVRTGRMRIMEVMAEATNTIAEGEVLQLMNCNDPDTNEASYFNVIHGKTAKLFEAAARVGAIVAEARTNNEIALAAYGLHIGVAFQLVDDALDFSGSLETMGKNIGDDLAEGKPTLPLIHAMRVGSPAERTLIREAIREGDINKLPGILDAIESTGALIYTARLAREQAGAAAKALDALPDSRYRDALVTLARAAVERSA